MLEAISSGFSANGFAKGGTLAETKEAPPPLVSNLELILSEVEVE